MEVTEVILRQCSLVSSMTDKVTTAYRQVRTVSCICIRFLPLSLSPHLIWPIRLLARFDTVQRMDHGTGEQSHKPTSLSGFRKYEISPYTQSISIDQRWVCGKPSGPFKAMLLWSASSVLIFIEVLRIRRSTPYGATNLSTINVPSP